MYHVLYVIHSLNIGGTERLVVDMVREFKSSFRASVCCLDAPGVWGEELRGQGVAVHSLNRRPGLDLHAAWRLGRILRETAVDIMHCHQYPAFFYGAIASRLAQGCKVVFTEHGRLYPDIVSRKRALANRLILSRLSNLTTAVSHAVKRSLAELDCFSADRIEVIPNGIDPDHYLVEPEFGACKRTELGIQSDEKAIVIVGRLDPVKDHATLLHAFQAVYHACPQARLFVVGDGETRHELKALAAELRIDPYVRFLGFRNDVHELLCAFDVFVLSSRVESMPVTILEAMAARLPVVATAVGDVPDIVIDGVTGFVCPPADPKILSHRILKLLCNDEMRCAMGQAGRERVLRDYTREAMFNRYVEIYSRVGNAT